MIRNYLTIAFRSLRRNKAHSIINITGLGLGIGCCILIVLFVNDELTFDRFHKKADRIFRVFARENWGENQDFFYTTTPFPMGPTLKENLPEIENYVRIVQFGTQVRAGEELFNETVTIADRDIFNVFDFEVSSDRENALAQQSSIVISDWVAKKYFGESDPHGKLISLQMGEEFIDFTVSAVAAVPTNSSIQFSMLIPDHNLTKLYSPQALTSAWFNINPETYVLLREGATRETVMAKFPALFKRILGEEQYKQSNYAPGLQPLLGIHLDPDYPVGLAQVNNPRYAYILAAIALLILVVGCINFVTLSIGRSMKRAKEVGIRKVVGALRKQLIFQFIGEAVIVTSMSMIVGLGLSLANLSLFNDLAGKQMSFPVNGFMAAVLGGLLLIIGIIAGSYPAFVLSGFKPISILKGSVSVGNKQGLRKALVGIQLVLSIFLISSTLIMRDQLQFLQNKNLGFNKEQLAVVGLNVPRGGRLAERVNRGFEKAEQIKAELAKLADVASVCASSHDFANGSWTNVGFTDDNGTYRTFNLNVIDDDYIPAMKMEMVAGRNFSDETPSDKRRSIIVNQAFTKMFGWGDATGKKIPGKGFADHEVIGVVKDFNYSSLYTAVEPLVMVEDPAIILQGIENINIGNSPIPKLMIRLRPGNMVDAIGQVRNVWEKFTDGEEFTFTFVDEALASQYRADQNLGKIVSIATLLAILIGGLGLYGLASLTMQNRVKEISIRKVLGATERSLIVLLSREYVYLILLSLIISIPVTWYMMNDWLTTFEYRVAITADIFLLAGVIALVIALLTISYQAIKTAWSQPADTLKYE